MAQYPKWIMSGVSGVLPQTPKPQQVNLFHLKLDLVGQAPLAFYEWYKMLVQLSIIRKKANQNYNEVPDHTPQTGHH